MALFTIGTPEVYDPLLEDGLLVKMGRRNHYIGGIVFPDLSHAQAVAQNASRLYHVYELEGNFKTDSYIPENLNQRYLIPDAWVIRKVWPEEIWQEKRSKIRP